MESNTVKLKGAHIIHTHTLEARARSLIIAFPIRRLLPFKKVVGVGRKWFVIGHCVHKQLMIVALSSIYPVGVCAHLYKHH